MSQNGGNDNVAAAMRALRAIRAKQGGDSFGYAPREVAPRAQVATPPPSQGSGGKKD